jgi:hypothetical protein
MINLPSSLAKGEILIFALNKALVTSAASDSYWSDAANIQKCIVVYKSTSGHQRKKLEFDFTQESPTTTAEWSVKARNAFEIEEIVLIDFDNGSYTIPRASLPSGKGISFSGDNEVVVSVSDYYAPNGVVNEIIAGADGVYVGGAFTGLQHSAYNAATISSTTGENLVKDQIAGKFPIFDAVIRCAIFDGSNTLFVGGAFTTMNGVARNGIAKLIRSGDSWVSDTTWNEINKRDVPGGVFSLNIYGDELYIGMSNSGYRDNVGVSRGIYFAAVNKTTGAHIASATSTSTDGNFKNRNGSHTACIEVDENNTYFACGFDSTGYVFGRYNRTTKAIDRPMSSVSFGISSTVGIFALKSIGNYLYVGGNSLLISGAVTNRRSMFRVDKTTFQIDSTFNPLTTSSTTGTVRSFVQTSATELVVGGTFAWTTAYGANARNIVKVNVETATGISGFNTGYTFTRYGQTSGVYDIKLSGSSLYVFGQFDGREVVGSSITCLNVAKIDAMTGQLDSSFISSNNLMNPASNIIYSGNFTGSNLFIVGTFSGYGGYAAQGVAKLSRDTSGNWKVVQSFNSANGGTSVNTMLLIGNDLYVGGSFTSWNGVTRNRIAKLNATTGQLDSNFAVGVFTTGQFNGLGADVYKMVYDSEKNKIYVGGLFSTYSKKSSATSTTSPAAPRWLIVDPSTNTETVPSGGIGYACYGMCIDGNNILLTGLDNISAIGFYKRSTTDGSATVGFSNMSTGGTNYYYSDAIIMGDYYLLPRQGGFPMYMRRSDGLGRVTMATGSSATYPSRVFKDSDGTVYLSFTNFSTGGILKYQLVNGIPTMIPLTTWGFVSDNVISGNAGGCVFGNEIIIGYNGTPQRMVCIDKATAQIKTNL